MLNKNTLYLQNNEGHSMIVKVHGVVEGKLVLNTEMAGIHLELPAAGEDVLVKWGGGVF